jgi:hypothetical protein
MMWAISVVLIAIGLVVLRVLVVADTAQNGPESGLARTSGRPR